MNGPTNPPHRNTSTAHAAGSSQQLVKNLDLAVVPPPGPVARGNAGNSSSVGQAADTINNPKRSTRVGHTDN
jgi:hypothetical protein